MGGGGGGLRHLAVFDNLLTCFHDELILVEYLGQISIIASSMTGSYKKVDGWMDDMTYDMTYDMT